MERKLTCKETDKSRARFVLGVICDASRSIHLAVSRRPYKHSAVELSSNVGP